MSKEDFYSLTPDEVLQATERLGVRASGEFLQLNSYENRVFEVFLEEPNPLKMSRVICKFYRPLRWSEEAILEEHRFMQELKDAGVQSVPAITLPNKSTVLIHNGMKVGFFPKIRGRLVQELLPDDFTKIGRALARFHNVGAGKKFEHRPSLTVDEILEPAVDASMKFCAPEVIDRYLDAADRIADFLDEHLHPENFIRIHGDFHKGNFLQTDQADGQNEFLFVDFDDCVMGPPTQDFWMLFSDSTNYEQELELLLTGYRELRDLSAADLRLLPALRGLRILHYSGWIARRWEDPSFPKLFPRFQDYNHWAEETEALERIARSL